MFSDDFLVRDNLWLMPNLCCSSTMMRPSFKKLTFSWIKEWVPINISVLPDKVDSIILDFSHEDKLFFNLPFIFLFFRARKDCYPVTQNPNNKK